MARRKAGHITVVDHQFMDGSTHSDAEFEAHADVLSEEAFNIPAFAAGVKRIYMKQITDKEVS
ncbi:hypothetical protein [Lactiplantibacillus brownii]|uniref:hypothetical protein n=1 Tax=Lactiplantibacillus brownii TaxID=3069269 RepID=UPI0038B2DB72